VVFISQYVTLVNVMVAAASATNAISGLYFFLFAMCRCNSGV